MYSIFISCWYFHLAWYLILQATLRMGKFPSFLKKYAERECVCLWQFLYSFVYQWTVRLFLSLGCGKYCWNRHGITGVSLKYWFQAIVSALTHNPSTWKPETGELWIPNPAWATQQEPNFKNQTKTNNQNKRTLIPSALDTYSKICMVAGSCHWSALNFWGNSILFFS